jgi:hypothetical protein
MKEMSDMQLYTTEYISTGILMQKKGIIYAAIVGKMRIPGLLFAYHLRIGSLAVNGL